MFIDCKIIFSSFHEQAYLKIQKGLPRGRYIFLLLAEQVGATTFL